MDDFIKIFFFLLMLLVSYFIGNIISKQPSFGFLKERGDRLGAIDGLRGYLAISIFVHHFMLTWVWKNSGHWYRPKEIYFQNVGIIGVMIFFMITGYLFTSKLLADKGKTDWVKLFKSRLFRIYPLYLFVIILISLVIFTQPQYQTHINISQIANQYLQWVLFHGQNIHIHDHTPLIIAGVDWTLKYEWLFYLSLPLIALLLYLNRWFTLFLVLVGTYIFAQDYKIYAFNTIHLLFFIIGGITAYLNYSLKKEIDIKNSKIIALLSLSLLISSLFFKDIYQPIPILFVSLFFVSVALGNTLFGILSKPSSVLLGEISYSIYLLHGFIIYLSFSVLKLVNLQEISAITHTMMMPLLIIVVIFFSTLTYLYIEKPAIAFGKKSLKSKKQSKK